jgi:hypothetical protein
MARARSFNHIYVCIRWPQVSQHLPSFITLAVTGWHSNSYDIKHGTSQPRRMVYVVRSGYSSKGTCYYAHILFISRRLQQLAQARQLLVCVGMQYPAWNLSELFLEGASVFSLGHGLLRGEKKMGSCMYTLTKLVNLRHLSTNQRFVWSLAFNCQTSNTYFNANEEYGFVLP